MTTTIRFCALSLAIVTTTAWAQESNSASDNPKISWKENAIARCVEQYGEEQCQDEEFLEANFHITSLGVAHRAAIRRNRSAEKAMHEVILQYACNEPPKKVCEGNESTQCMTEVAQTCIKLKKEAVACIQDAKQGCAPTVNPNTCFAQHIAQCPSQKKQPIAELLKKYPKLSSAQRSKLITTAQTLEKKTSGWWSNLVDWITFN